MLFLYYKTYFIKNKHKLNKKSIKNVTGKLIDIIK